MSNPIEELMAEVAAMQGPLGDKLARLKAKFEGEIAPKEMVAVMHKATDDLIASGQAQRALHAGDRAPNFTLPAPDGTPVSSKELLAKGPLVVTFYRGAWCPYCNFDLRALEEVRPQVEARGAALVAISPQTAANSRRSQRENNLGFPILSDEHGNVAHQFGLRWKVPADLQQIHKTVGADLEVFNGDTDWTLPMPGRYVIDRDGLIAYAEVNPDYTRRPEPTDLFPVLDALQKASIR